MPISARNRVQGRVTDIHSGKVMSLVTIQAVTTAWSLLLPTTG